MNNFNSFMRLFNVNQNRCIKVKIIGLSKLATCLALKSRYKLWSNEAEFSQTKEMQVCDFVS